MKSLADTVRETAGKKAKYNFDYYFVGDEGSLTSYTDNVDFCWGPHTLAAFRKWLAGEYGSLNALNKEWKTDYKDWAAVVPYTAKEALETGDFAPWADHRTFMEITFADAYSLVRDAVARATPTPTSRSPVPRSRRPTTAATGTGSTRSSMTFSLTAAATSGTFTARSPSPAR
ncbi:MAG: beta-galactosidase [Planctomycetes bacterium]|nr:beta-galactosidase [Planctomycetota bacterium]